VEEIKLDSTVPYVVVRHDTVCRICGSDQIDTLFELRATPLEDLFLPIDKVAESKNRYPLELAMCSKCNYLHLPHIVEPKHSYEHYLYVTESTVGLPEHYLRYAETALGYFRNNKEIFAVDLGSNDGTMLRAFEKVGVKTTLGIEPNQRIAHLANQIAPTWATYFDETCALKIESCYGKPQLITANYMLANVDDVGEFLENVTKLLSPDGVFVVETGYHPEQMKKFMFDYIYHEHYSYFSVQTLKYLFNIKNLQILNVELFPPKGGSIRITAQHRSGPRSASPDLEAFIEYEENHHVHHPSKYRTYFHELEKKKDELTAILDRVQNSNESIVGYGASHSTTTLIHQFELAKYIDSIVDDNIAKQNTYSPGYHIPVKSPTTLKQKNPDWVLILGWQHTDVICNRIVDLLGNQQKVIVPLPNPKIYSNLTLVSQ